MLAFAAAAAGVGVRATYGARTTADEPQYLLTALSIAEDGDLDIADELRGQRWRDFHEAQLPQQTRRLPGGHRVSPHDPLLPLLLAGPMALGGWLGAKLALAALAGLLAALLAWTASVRFRVPGTVALLVSGVFAASAPLANYGSQVYPELPAALCVTVALAALTSSARGAPELGRAARWAVAAAVVALPWLAVKYTPVAAALAALALVRLWRAGQRGEAMGLAFALVAAGGVFAVLHQLVYGGWTAYASGDHFVGGELTAIGFQPDYLGRSRRLLGLLVGRRFGLAAWQPAWLLVVPAGAWLLRRRPAGWDVVVLPLAVGWLNATFVALTMHGYWFPGRQVVVVLPAAVLAVALWAAEWRPARWIVVALGAAGVWSYGRLVTEGLRGRITWVVDFFGVADPWYRAWSPLLPDYLQVTLLTWVLHWLWLAAALAAGWWAWRRAGHPRQAPAPRPVPQTRRDA